MKKWLGTLVMLVALLIIPSVGVRAADTVKFISGQITRMYLDPYIVDTGKIRDALAGHSNPKITQESLIPLESVDISRCLNTPVAYSYNWKSEFANILRNSDGPLLQGTDDCKRKAKKVAGLYPIENVSPFAVLLTRNATIGDGDLKSVGMLIRAINEDDSAFVFTKLGPDEYAIHFRVAITGYTTPPTAYLQDNNSLSLNHNPARIKLSNSAAADIFLKNKPVEFNIVNGIEDLLQKGLVSADGVISISYGADTQSVVVDTLNIKSKESGDKRLKLSKKDFNFNESTNTYTYNVSRSTLGDDSNPSCTISSVRHSVVLKVTPANFSDTVVGGASSTYRVDIAKSYIFPTNLTYKGFDFTGTYTLSCQSPTALAGVISTNSTLNTIQAGSTMGQYYTKVCEVLKQNAFAVYNSFGYRGLEVGSPLVIEVTTTPNFVIHNYKFNYTGMEGATVRGTNPATFTCHDQFNIEPAEKKGYTFLKWATADGAEFQGVQRGKYYSDITVHPEFQINKYSITYKYGEDDGVNEDDLVKEYDVETAVELPVLSKDGYEWKGWFRSADWTSEPTQSIEKGSVGNVNLYAKFFPIMYSIEYETNEGELASDSPEKYSIEDTAWLSTPSREGYTFEGWFLDEACEGPQIKFFPYDDKLENVKVYAKWKSNEEIAAEEEQRRGEAQAEIDDKKKAEHDAKPDLPKVTVDTDIVDPESIPDEKVEVNEYKAPEEEAKEVVNARNTAKAQKLKVHFVTLKNKKKGQMKISWKKVKGVSGYEVQVSTNKKFKKASTKRVKSNKVTLKGKSVGVRYYVRVRTYKKVAGKRVYGRWSSRKYIRIKK